MYNLLGGDIDGNSNKNAEFDYKLKSESYGINKRQSDIDYAKNAPKHKNRIINKDDDL